MEKGEGRGWMTGRVGDGRWDEWRLHWLVEWGDIRMFGSIFFLSLPLTPPIASFRHPPSLTDKKLSHHNTMARQHHQKHPVSSSSSKLYHKMGAYRGQDNSQSLPSSSFSSSSTTAPSIDRLPPFKPSITPPYSHPSYPQHPPNYNNNNNNNNNYPHGNYLNNQTNYTNPPPGFCIPLPTLPPSTLPPPPPIGLPLSSQQHASLFMNGWNQFELLTQMASKWCGAVWCSVVWCGVVWCGVVRCDVVWCGVVWCGVVWCGVVWCSVARCGVVWCGVV